MPTSTGWYIDRYWADVVNGNFSFGDHAEMESRLTHEQVRDIRDTYRTTTLAQLERCQLYALDRLALEIAQNTARKLLADGDALRPPAFPRSHVWIELLGNLRLGDEHMAIRAWFYSRSADMAQITFIDDIDHTKMLAGHVAGQWVFEQGVCAHSCAGTREGTMVPLAPLQRGCACQDAGRRLLALLTALAMVMRAEGIEREVVYRPQVMASHQRPRAKVTRRARQVHPARNINVLHLMTQYVDAPIEAEEDDPERDYDRAQGYFGPHHPVYLQPFVRHLDPARNSRWIEERFVVVRGHIRSQPGLTPFTVVTA